MSESSLQSQIAQTTAILASAGMMFSAAALFATDGTAPNQPASAVNDLEITNHAVFLEADNWIRETIFALAASEFWPSFAH
jgi:hypothetical protein